MRQSLIRQIWKRSLSACLSLLLIFTMVPSGGLWAAESKESAFDEVRQNTSVKAADDSDMLVTAVQSSLTDSSRKNYFTYTAYEGKSWTNTASESYIDLGASDSRAEECYYEIHFEGNAISVFAVKGPTHGKVKFILDNGTEEVVDLYNGSRIQAEEVYSAHGLAEGEHVLRAVTQTEKSGSRIVNQVVYAEVTHKPYKGGEPDLGGTIEDTNLQYTQERYSEIAAKNTDSVQLSAWKNDKATSELVLYSKNCSLDNVCVTTGSLTSGENTIPAENVTATFIKSVKAYNGGYLGYGSKDREVPAATAGNRSESSDVLYQQGGFVDLGWNSLQPVWVEFNIPKDAEAGTYTGTLTASADGIAEPLTFTYTIEVADVTLPDAEEFSDTFDIELWQYPYSSAEYYGVTPFSEEHLALMESSMRKYKEIGGHAITTSIVEEAWNGQTYSKNDVHYPSMIKWIKEEDGTFVYDYTDFEKWVTFCKGLGIGDKIVLYSIAPWHNSFAYWENDELKYQAYTAGSEEYTALWTDFLTDLVFYLEDKGWFDESYIGIDERGFSAAAFDVVESVTNSQGESLKTAGAMDRFIEKRDLAMRVDDLNIGDNAAADHPSEFAELLKDRTEAGLRTTLYSCTEHKPGNFSLSAPAESYWSVVNAAKMGTSGFLRWAYDAWVEDPLRDATHNAFEPGDCFLIYPDEKDAETPESKSSVRLERMAEGIRDVNKLIYMERQAPELADEIRSLYERIKTNASSVTGGRYLTEDEKNSLKAEMADFKAGVAEITDSFVQYTSGAKEGLYLLTKKKEMKIGGSFKILSKLVTNDEDKTIIYKSEDPSVASVDASGTVTARRLGSTKIIARYKRFIASVEITVTTKDLIIKNTLTDYKLPEQYLSDVMKGPQTGKRSYLGQPDMVMLDDEQTLYTAFPEYHGHGALVMMKSTDAGGSWTEKTDIPASWTDSLETPTMYKLKLKNGDTKLLLIAGRPQWDGNNRGGWDVSVSDDEGETWSEFETFHETIDGSQNYSVVAMASLIQIRDENGEPMDKWMGVFHNLNYVNYKTYLTFDENGNQQWSEPEPYLSEYRSIESSHQICEVGMFRSPDGGKIVALARSQSHAHPATMFYSEDEGETWSEPVHLPGSLAGERHKIMYDPTDETGQRLLVTFREIQYDREGNDNQFGNDWMAGDWIAWVGTYDDIMNQREGDYRILLCEDWSANARSGDTGYSGLVVQKDGTFIIDSYGHWDKEYSSAHPDVRTDWCWIKQAKFKLSVFDNQVVPKIKEELEAEMENLPSEQEKDKYTEESWANLMKALEKAEQAEDTQADCYAALIWLREAKASLAMKGAEYEGTPVMEITISPASLSFDKIGGKQRLTAKALPAEATNQDVIWSTENAQVAEVSADGEVTAKGNGTAKIRAEAADGLGAAAEVTITVEDPGTGSKPDDGDQNNPNPTPENPDQNNPKPGNPDPGAPGTPDAPLKNGDTKQVGKIIYKVLNAGAKTVTVSKGKSAKNKSVKIPASVTINNVKCKVTAIENNAFKNYSSLTSVTIGANVKTIGKNAFLNCRKLKTVILEGKALKSIKAGAFKKTSAKITVKAKKMTKKQKAGILKKMKAAGMNKKAKIK